MLYSFTWKGVRTAAYNKQFLCQTFLLPCIKQPGICPMEKDIREGRGRERMESQSGVNYRGATG